MTYSITFFHKDRDRIVDMENFCLDNFGDGRETSPDELDEYFVDKRWGMYKPHIGESPLKWVFYFKNSDDATLFKLTWT